MSKSFLKVSPAVEINVKGTKGPDEKTMLVRAMLGGTLAADNIDTLKAWAHQLAAAIETTSESADRKPICVIIDISTFEMYSDPQVLTVLAQLMRADNPYVRKTATFGGRIDQEMIENIIKGFAGRDNLQNFKTEAEAMEWLAS
jgi:hypothetical protein